MGIKIKGAYQCPHCEEVINSSRRPKVCPGCNYDFGSVISDYKYPHTLREQFEKLNDKPAFYDTVINMPIEKANAIMNDALNIIETISAKNVQVSDISQVIRMSIKIGQIATKYHEYLAEGGKHAPALFMVEEKDELPASGDGEKVT